ncbi:hypothetical protein CCP2SC5_1060008 [Azospirillaceae bacterium]
MHMDDLVFRMYKVKYAVKQRMKKTLSQMR